MIELTNRYRKDKIESIQCLGLNMMTVPDFLRAFRSSGLSTVEFRVNQSRGILLRTLSLLTKLSLLSVCCQHNIYCILEKPLLKPVGQISQPGGRR